MSSSSLSLSSKDTWNKKFKNKDEYELSKTCVYRQVYNVNPLMGGFSVFGNNYENSTFNSYSFTGNYKLVVEGNYVKIITTESCSNMSVSFYRALVIFQPIVKPDSRYTECSQDVIFNENEYNIEITPFDIQPIRVGTMIVATNGTLHFTTFNLPSKTNQDKISKALYEYILTIEPKMEIVDEKGKLLPMANSDVIILNPSDLYYNMTIYPVKGVSPNRYQYIQLYTNFTHPYWKWDGWTVVQQRSLDETTDVDGTRGYKLLANQTYYIGFFIKYIGPVLIAPGFRQLYYDIYNTILQPGTSFNIRLKYTMPSNDPYFLK